MTIQVAADLRAAAEVLRRDGWTQGSFVDTSSCRRCVLGAVEEAVGAFEADWDEASWARREEAARALRRHLHEGPIVWNDTPGRTADEVIAALEAAADAAERGES